jgi:O-succinylhomoserine sulfhydrylase
LGGAVVGRNELIKDVYAVLRTAGFSLSPFNAWVFLKGLETLKIRMEAHSRNALALAQWLATLADVTQVHYCGLPSHAQYERVLRQQTGFGGLLSFEVKGGQPQAWSIMDNTRLLSITANLGDAKTTLTHPATTTHGRLTPEQRAATGIGDGLIRVAVGLENIKDIQADLLRGF